MTVPWFVCWPSAPWPRSDPGRFVRFANAPSRLDGTPTRERRSTGVAERPLSQMARRLRRPREGYALLEGHERAFRHFNGGRWSACTTVRGRSCSAGRPGRSAGTRWRRTSPATTASRPGPASRTGRRRKQGRERGEVREAQRARRPAPYLVAGAQCVARGVEPHRGRCPVSPPSQRRIGERGCISATPREDGHEASRDVQFRHFFSRALGERRVLLDRESVAVSQETCIRIFNPALLCRGSRPVGT
jgi:hypothetical protein